MSTSDRGELITPLIRSIQTQANIFTLMPPTSKIKAYSVLDFIKIFCKSTKQQPLVCFSRWDLNCGLLQSEQNPNRYFKVATKALTLIFRIFRLHSKQEVTIASCPLLRISLQFLWKLTPGLKLFSFNWSVRSPVTILKFQKPLQTKSTSTTSIF